MGEIWRRPPGHPGYDTPGGPRTYSPGGPRSHSGGCTRNHIPGYPGAKMGGRPRADSPGYPRSYLGGYPRGHSGGGPPGHPGAALGGAGAPGTRDGTAIRFPLGTAIQFRPAKLVAVPFRFGNWWLYRSARDADFALRLDADRAPAAANHKLQALSQTGDCQPSAVSCRPLAVQWSSVRAIDNRNSSIANCVSLQRASAKT
jgi:hypothetical protein